MVEAGPTADFEKENVAAREVIDDIQTSTGKTDVYCWGEGGEG